MKSSAVCLVDVGADKKEKSMNSSSQELHETPLHVHPASAALQLLSGSPFARKGGVARDRLGRHVVVGVGAVEEGLPPLALGEGGVQGEARALQTQRGVTRRHAILRLVAGAQGRGGRSLSACVEELGVGKAHAAKLRASRGKTCRRRPA